MQFDEAFTKNSKRARQPEHFRQVIGGLSDEDARHFFRSVTALNAIPQSDGKNETQIRVVPKDVGDTHLTFSTCYFEVFLPDYGDDVDLMREKTLESIHPLNCEFAE